MTYNEFKNKYNGKVVDYDGAYGGQCWDLAQQYFVECLGLSPSILGGCGLVNNMLKEPKISELLKYFDEVPTNDMTAGDVVIWEVGHIAIFDIWNGVACIYLTQNPGATHLGQCNLGKCRAFRKKGWKKEEPKKPEVKPEPKPQPKEEPKKEEGLKVGDKVKPTKLVDYNGTPLVQYDDSYTIIELIGDRAVLEARGQVWAAMNTKNIERA